MDNVEESVKSQFTKVYVTSDWILFKQMAEVNLKEAAQLMKRNMSVAPALKLLARNSRKRLLIGVGVELLMKALYLKSGYAINKPPKNSGLQFPFLEQDAKGVDLIPDQTYTLNVLIQNLPKVVQLRERESTLIGLKIAKVFRNKEGHGVTWSHLFDPSNYADIATSLSALYRDAFGEKLVVNFSMAPQEVAVWRVSRPRELSEA